MIRELSDITERKMFRDDSEIELAIILNKGNIIENQTVTQSAIQFMVEGETRIDMVANRNVTKVNGKLYRQVAKDEEIVFEEII